MRISTIPINKGTKLHKLTAMSNRGHDRHGKILWLWKCDCGQTITVSTNAVRRGNTTSCGCYRLERLREEMITHGHAKAGHRSRTYRIWCNMKTRCDKIQNPAWKHYGGRGIQYCRRWIYFKEFLKDMGECPKGLTLDRTNNNCGYSKKNCRWVSTGDQARNRRNNIFLLIGGIRHCLKDACAVLGLSYGAILTRIRRGKIITQAIG